jgi:glutamyl-tRNA synthetase
MSATDPTDSSVPVGPVGPVGLDRSEIDALFAADLPDPAHWEQTYPPRPLAGGAEVTRFGPSPTGFVHIGGVYVAHISRDVAHHSGGVYFVRIEDTDQSREVEGAYEQFERAFRYFRIEPDEDPATGPYGPYRQSQRERIYQSYVRDLMRRGVAYPCFATSDELSDIASRQEAAKLPPGYYGTWALWRDADPTLVRSALAEGRPYVVRFRAPDAPAPARFVDAIRGAREIEGNRNDAVILKSSDRSPRLPTYHFAHAVDDHLMRVTTVIRGDEWFSSIPLHLQLFGALGFEPVRYAHIAPLSKPIKGGRRKLSKRKDPEASVDYYIEAGYPADAVLYYLRGLANGRLAELPELEALVTPIELDRLGVAGPLVDLVKLDDISADHVAGMPNLSIFEAVAVWSAEYDPELAALLATERERALLALAVERDGVANPRKDLRKWSEFRSVYGFFFPGLFTLVEGFSDERLAALKLPPATAAAFVRELLDNYTSDLDSEAWFDQIRTAARAHGIALTAAEQREAPDRYVGVLRDAAQLVRVAITGSTKSPDLYAISQAMGPDEFCRRLRPLAPQPG